MRGKEAVVVLSVEDYRQIAPKQESMADFLMNSPLRGSGIEIAQEQDFGRDIKL